MNNNVEKIETTGDLIENMWLKEIQRKKAYHAKFTSEKKAELNKKNWTRYYRDKCVNNYALKYGISSNQVNNLINNKKLIYSKDNNELLTNHWYTFADYLIPITLVTIYKIHCLSISIPLTRQIIISWVFFRHV